MSICDKWHRRREVQSPLEPPVLGDSVEQAEWVDQIFAEIVGLYLTDNWE